MSFPMEMTKKKKKYSLPHDWQNFFTFNEQYMH